MKFVFFDTSPLIYYLDGIEPFASKVENYMLSAMDNKCALYTSSITDMEYLVYPYRKKNITKISTYKSFLRNAQFLKVSIDEKIAETAAQIRAKYSGIKSMDALQLASAMISGCDVFLTNDKQLRQVNEIQVLLVDDL